jgi:hypothetical protein
MMGSTSIARHSAIAFDTVSLAVLTPDSLMGFEPTITVPFTVDSLGNYPDYSEIKGYLTVLIIH